MELWFAITIFLCFGIIFSLLIVMFVVFYKRVPKSSKSKNHFFKKIGDQENESELVEFVHQLSWALYWLSARKIGALIVIEGKNKLDIFATLGYALKSKATAELLISIFSNKDSALHDGGVIIRGTDVISVSTYFPVPQLTLDVSHGARHRASMGVTMNSDALALIVSESKGSISFSSKGKIKEVFFGSNDDLSDFLYDLLKKHF